MPYDKIFENPSTIKMSALFYSDQNRLGKSRILKKNMTKLLKAGEEDSKFLEIIAVEVGRIRTVFDRSLVEAVQGIALSRNDHLPFLKFETFSA